MAIGVKVRNNNLNEALKIFNKKVYDSELMLDYNEKSFFQSKSEKRNIIKSKHRYTKKIRKRLKNSKISLIIK
jgi:ribosomal protein S21